MPANLPPQYYELERQFKSETNNAEKLRMARELLRMMPKHKGTEKLQAEMKGKISALNKLSQAGEKSHGARQAHSHDHIDREGSGQIILIGPPNSGKSSLLETLTHARPLVADYPYTTREPMSGMMLWETVHLQLIDSPPVSPESFEPYLGNLVRQADLVVLVADLSLDSCLNDLQFVTEKFEEKRILLHPADFAGTVEPQFVVRKTIICAHKEYEDESGERLRQIRENFDGFDIVATSILDDQSLESFQRRIFDSLGVIRVYTKHIGKPVEKIDPVVLPIGGTVEDAAREIHKDFASSLKFAKIWGDGKFEGQRVNGDFRLGDGDIVEFHM